MSSPTEHTGPHRRDCPWWCTSDHRSALPAHRHVAGEFLRPDESLAIEVVQEPEELLPTVVLSHYFVGALPRFTNLTRAELRTLQRAATVALRASAPEVEYGHGSATPPGSGRGPASRPTT